MEGRVILEGRVKVLEDRIEELEGLLSSHLLEDKSPENLIDTTLKANTVKQESFIDALTGLHNRKKMDLDLETLKISGVIIIDIDKFKTINDSRGYEVGDTVLKELAISLSSTFADEGCYSCYRQGGDEFVIFTTDLDYVRVQRKLSKFIRNFEEKTVEGIKCQLSVGYAYNSVTNKLGLNWATHYLHQGKLKGRHCSVIGSCGDKEVRVEEEKRVYDKKW